MRDDSTLAESVAGALRHAIQQGSYMSGERLVELSLAHEMNVSQNTVRDALRILEGEGWVVKHPRRGVYVRTFTEDEAEEITLLRSAVEGLALGWAMEKLSPEDCQRLEEAIESAEQHIRLGNWKGAQEATFAFHTTIAQIAAKSETAALLARLHNGARLLQNLRELHSPQGLDVWSALLTAYHSLLNSMQAGDGIQASQMLQAILSGQDR